MWWCHYGRCSGYWWCLYGAKARRGKLRLRRLPRGVIVQAKGATGPVQGDPTEEPTDMTRIVSFSSNESFNSQSSVGAEGSNEGLLRGRNCSSSSSNLVEVSSPRG